MECDSPGSEKAEPESEFKSAPQEEKKPKTQPEPEEAESEEGKKPQEANSTETKPAVKKPQKPENKEEPEKSILELLSDPATFEAEKEKLHDDWRFYMTPFEEYEILLKNVFYKIFKRDLRR